MKIVVVVVAALALTAGLASCRSSPPSGPSAVEVVDAFSAEGTVAVAIYLQLANPGGPDSIVGADLVGDWSDAADDITLHQTKEEGGLAIMSPTDRIVVAGGTDDALAPSGAHMMLANLDRPVTVSDEIEVRLDFARGDDIVATVRVVTADQAIGLLSGDAP